MSEHILRRMQRSVRRSQSRGYTMTSDGRILKLSCDNNSEKVEGLSNYTLVDRYPRLKETRFSGNGAVVSGGMTEVGVSVKKPGKKFPMSGKGMIASGTNSDVGALQNSSQYSSLSSFGVSGMAQCRRGLSCSKRMRDDDSAVGARKRMSCKKPLNSLKSAGKSMTSSATRSSLAKTNRGLPTITTAHKKWLRNQVLVEYKHHCALCEFTTRFSTHFT